MLERLIGFSLKNWLLVIFAILILVFLGVGIFRQIPVDVYPDINDPRVTILTEAPGWSPEEVEKLVTFPLESVFNGAPYVKRVRSSSGVGISVIFVEFEWGTDILVARQMVTERLQIAAPRLPEGVETPFMAPISSRLGEIVEYVLENKSDGKISLRETRDITDWIIRFRLQALGGIANVINMGGFVKQFRVLIHPQKLINYHLTLSDVREALEASNINSAGGFLIDNSEELLIRGLGRVHTVEDIQNVVITTKADGLPILVKDVAEVKIGAITKRRRGAGSLNGEEAVLGKVSKQPGVNTLKVTKKILKAFKELKTSLPKGVSIRAEYLQADLIMRSVNTVKNALFQGGFLVIIVLVLFLYNFRASLITLATIPLSLILAVLILYWRGFTLNIMTLAGLAIAIGIVVDATIVFVENNFRRLGEYFHNPTAETPQEIVQHASQEFARPIVFATTIIILVFLPIFALGGLEGRLFSPLAVAVIASMGMALLVALTVTPVLCKLLLTKGKRLRNQESPLVKFLRKPYRGALKFTLNRPKWVITWAVFVFLLSLFLIPRMGTEFLPIMDEGTLVINARLEPGISLEESKRIGNKIEEVLLKFPEVVSTTNRTGRAEQDEHAEGVSTNEILVTLVPKEKRTKSKDELLHDIREKLSEFPGVVINTGQPLQHRIDHLLSGVTAQVAIKLFGSDLDILRSKAKEIEKIVSEVEGIADLQIEQQVEIPQLLLDVDREAASRFGLSVGEIAHFVETAFNGEVVSEVILGQRQYDLFIRLDEESVSDLEVIKNLRIATPAGPRVPLQRIANIRIGKGPNTINRENVSRRIVIQSNVSGRDLGGFVKEIREKISQQITLPEGYFITYGGQFESQQRAMRQLSIMLVIILVAIFLMIHLNFGSAKISLLIMLNLPLALVGGIVSVFISGGVLSISSAVGFILLFGIAVSNGIVLITHIKDLREKGGIELKESIMKGSEARLSPVLMTALTDGLGMLPLALANGTGAEIQKPLAIVIVGGLVTSTILTLLVLPAFYYVIERRAKKQQTEIAKAKEM